MTFMTFEILGYGIVLNWPDVLGTFGVVAVLICYFLLQSEKVKFNDYSFYALNAGGSGLIMISLLYSFNFASFLVECFWFSISIYGLIRRLMKTA